jgi:phytoene desaturase
VRIVIIGGGLGGLAAALRLRARGHAVTLCEANERLGGKMNLRERDGWRFDLGPSLLTMPFVLEELFAATGARLADYLELQPVSPVCRYFWPDGLVLDAKCEGGIPRFTRPETSTAAFDLARANAEAARFHAHARGIYELSADAFLFHAPEDWRHILRLANLPKLVHLPKVATRRTLHDLNARSFTDPRLIQLFDRYATYNGSSPYATPAAFAVIPFVEHHFGAWHPRGGIYQIATALERRARELGVAIRSNCPVASILTEAEGRPPRACGVRLADGAELAADVVICNADAVNAGERLLGEPADSTTTNHPVPSLSGFILTAGVRTQFAHLAHHNIFFSRDYPAEFRAIFDEGRPAEDPTIYVAINARSDPTQAPSGCDNYFILVNAPALGERFAWDATATNWYASLVLARLEETHGLRGLRAALAFVEPFTPADFAVRYGAWRGTLYGHASHDRFSAFRRPPNRHPRLRNLYFVGGSTHPGGGIPLVLLSGKIVSELVERAAAQ